MFTAPDKGKRTCFPVLRRWSTAMNRVLATVLTDAMLKRLKGLDGLAHEVDVPVKAALDKAELRHLTATVGEILDLHLCIRDRSRTAIYSPQPAPLRKAVAHQALRRFRLHRARGTPDNPRRGRSPPPGQQGTPKHRHIS